MVQKWFIKNKKYFTSFHFSALRFWHFTFLYFCFFLYFHAEVIKMPTKLIVWYGQYDEHISVSNQTLSPVFLVCPPLCPSDCVAVTSNFLLDPAEMGWAGCGLVPALPPSYLCCSASSRDFHTWTQPSSSLLIPDIFGYRILWRFLDNICHNNLEKLICHGPAPRHFN